MAFSRFPLPSGRKVRRAYGPNVTQGDVVGGIGSSTWGDITGTLSDQLDLQAALDSIGGSSTSLDLDGGDANAGSSFLIDVDGGGA